MPCDPSNCVDMTTTDFLPLLFDSEYYIYYGEDTTFNCRKLNATLQIFAIWGRSYVDISTTNKFSQDEDTRRCNLIMASSHLLFDAIDQYGDESPFSFYRQIGPTARFRVVISGLP